MRALTIFYILFFFLPTNFMAQTIEDDFEGGGNITTWTPDQAEMDTSFANPFVDAVNGSATVLEYNDTGADYANVRFDVVLNFDLEANSKFTFKIYVPSSSISGSQSNQVALKLQNGTLPEPWASQTEIIKPLVLDTWQEITFDFASDPTLGEENPTGRTDFNRVLIQVNSEANKDTVIAYIDDFLYDGTIGDSDDPIYDNLVWADEFNGTGKIDTEKWFHQTQLPAGGNWYNGEVQHYTSREANSYLSNGSLFLMAKKETFNDQGHTKQYTSARLNSKFAFTYGRVEVKAILPAGVGTWPAIWMLGKNINEDGGYWDNENFGTTYWPACGEIDIMEHWGNNQNYAQSAMHTPSSHGNTVNHGGQTIATVSNEFHVYALEWSPEKMVFSVDGVVHYIYNPEIKDASTWPYDAEQYILLNIAIEPGIDQAFTESAMVIDYVRVYQERVLSVSEELTSQVLFYPNPVSQILNLNFKSSINQNIGVSVLDVMGRVVYQLNAKAVNQKLELNVAHLKQGVYFMQLNFDNGKSVTKKFVKK